MELCTRDDVEPSGTDGGSIIQPHGSPGTGDETSNISNPKRFLTCKATSIDIRQRMDDIYAQMEIDAQEGRMRIPRHFIGFHKTEIMFFFVRSAIVYSIAFVKVKCFEKESKEFFERSAQELSSSNKKNDPLIEQDLTQRLEKAIQIQQQNATAMASFYARLLLHCSNFENRKEDEHFFECIYFYVCAVVKLSIASEYWQLIEQELAFVFRGEQYSTNVRTHSSKNKDLIYDNSAQSKVRKRQLASAVAAAERDSSAFSSANFILPNPKYQHLITSSLPVKHLVHHVDSNKSRVEKNLLLSQAIRMRIVSQRKEDKKTRQLEALVSPRQQMKLDFHMNSNGIIITPNKPNCINKMPSPRISFNARSPAVNHLLPTNKDRVRMIMSSTTNHTFQGSQHENSHEKTFEPRPPALTHR